MAKLNSLFYQSLCKDWHGERYDGGNEVSAVFSGAFLATEAFSLKICNTLGDRFLLRHVGGSPGKNVSAFFTSPVTGGEDGSLLAETKSGADISLKDKVIVDAGGYVSKPSVDNDFTSCSVIKLWADYGFQDCSLFSNAGIGQEMFNKSSWNENCEVTIKNCKLLTCSSLTFITSDSVGAGSGGTADGGEEHKELHFQLRIW